MHLFITPIMAILLYTIIVTIYGDSVQGESIEPTCMIADRSFEYLQDSLMNETILYCDELRTMFLSKHINYWLYTRKQPEGQVLNQNNPNFMKETTFNVNNPIKVIVHGWRGELVGKESICENLMKGYLHAGEYNVICVKWKRPLFDINYLNAKLRVKNVGYNIANFLNFTMRRMKVGFENIHLIGHSLGAHIVGFAGKKLNGQISRITGLDPAKPLYRLSGRQSRIDKTDAKFVDIIHTNARILGIFSAVGDIDFYPNGGKQQPQFKFKDLVTGGARSHLAAIHYFAQSILVKNAFKAIRCSSWKEFKAQNCGDSANTTHMGEHVDQTHTGSYYLTVVEPYI